MILHLEQHGYAYSVSTEDDDQSVSEMVEIFKKLLLAAEYAPQNIDEIVYDPSHTNH